MSNRSVALSDISVKVSTHMYVRSDKRSRVVGKMYILHVLRQKLNSYIWSTQEMRIEFLPVCVGVQVH